MACLPFCCLLYTSLSEDVKKIIEAADRDDYPAIVVGEHHLAIHHYTDAVSYTHLIEVGREVKDSVNCLPAHQFLRLVQTVAVIGSFGVW